MTLYSPAAAFATKDAAADDLQSDTEAVHDAEAALHAADRAITGQGWPAANQKLQQGIDLVQFRSLSRRPGFIDDSEFALRHASVEERDRDLQTAAEFRL
jgi:hypothetical protein